MLQKPVFYTYPYINLLLIDFQHATKHYALFKEKTLK